MEEASFAGELSWAISSMSSARILQQLRQLGASDNKIQTMREKFLRIQESVEVVHSRGGVGTADNARSPRLNRWLKSVNDLTFYVEDTINEYVSEYGRRENRSFKKTSLFSLPCRMSYRVRYILSLLDELHKESSRLGLTRLEVPPIDRIDSNTLLDQVIQVPNPTSAGIVVGRTTEEETIIEARTTKETMIVQTLQGPRMAGDNDIFTIAIVGMAGIGKTTLANRVYMNQRIKNHFEKMFWVTVGEVFDATRILNEMLLSLPEEMLNLSEYEAAIKLRDIMKRKKTLIVLDDVWCVNQEQLRKLYALQSGGGRISILVTTRRIEAARSFVDSEIHPLQRLSIEESWSLFRFVASQLMPIEEGSELESAGRRIAKKCYGVPRVICKMAGTLANITTVREWETTVESELWEWILSALSLKFSSLPKALRRCFAYCSIFPKNASIGKLDLIRLWLAQGFLSEETIAERYFNIMLNKSLLQVCTQDEDGNVLDCTMHDLAYDLAVNFSRHDRVFIIADGNQQIQPGSLSDVRHLVISPPNNNMNEAQRMRIPAVRQLRTVYLMVREVPENLLSQARSLYVLKLDGIGLEEVPRDLDKLKYLRYLDLSNNRIPCLPESITQLHLLQTLLLIKCDELSTLSESLNNFINNLSLVELPVHLHSKNGASPALRTLPPINLNAEEAPKQLSDLGMRAVTAGVLCISGLEYVNEKEAAQEARIGSKSRLPSLELCWNNRSERLLEGSDSGNDEKVLDGLQPHPNIRRLKLINYDGQQFPKWVMWPMKGDDNERLYSLVRIELVNCRRCLRLPSMGELPCLQELVIDGMDNVESIGQELYYHADDNEEKDVLEVYFPVLTRLELRNFSRLKEWQPAPTGQMIHAFSRLDTLQVVNCPHLTSIPTDFPRTKNLLIQGVRIVRWRTSWVDTIIKNSSSRHTLISLVLCMVSGLDCLPRELFQCTSLEQLKLQKCEDLNSWPGNPWNPVSLKEFCIDRCSSLTHPPNARKFATLRSLNTLVIRGCRSLKMAPANLEMCTSLTRLAISNCSKLKFQDLRVPRSLKELDILDCEAMRSLPPGLETLANLQTLRIGGVIGDRFRYFPDCTAFRSLETVWLKGMPHVSSLPQQLKHLSQLKVLRIKSFSSLKELPDWICDDLINLQILIFEECNFLSQLPSQIKLTRLRNLRCLRIERCGILRRLYDNENGPKWKDICHVPHIKFDDRWLQGDRSSLLQENLINTCVEVPTAAQPEHEHDEHGQIWYDAPNNGNGARFSFNFYVLVFCVLNFVISSFLYWAIYKQVKQR